MAGLVLFKEIYACVVFLGVNKQQFDKEASQMYA
jgi:hypothetical protein